jgi:3-carboxy-cis,cis-muconate cycloisomerase
MRASDDFDPGFSTEAARGIWSNEARVRRFCEVEVALAHACADAGLIPRKAAGDIERAVAALSVDASELLADGWHAGTPIVALLRHLRKTLEPAEAAFVHFGATSQDIIDTATMLQAREALTDLATTLEAVSDALASTIERHSRDWVIGRTLMQPAVPMRFAWRVARWLEPVLEHLETIRAAAMALPVQLGGPVGDASTFGEAGPAVVEAFAKRLGLAVPTISWHTDRRPITSLASLGARCATIAATVASDLLLLSQHEVGEIRLPAGGSSSIPHKKNAMVAVRALAAARACHGVAGSVVGAPPHELERAAGSWQSEWFALPMVFHTAAAALDATRQAVSAMEFDARRAAENLGDVSLPNPAQADRLVALVVERHRRLRKRAPQ